MYWQDVEKWLAEKGNHYHICWAWLGDSIYYPFEAFKASYYWHFDKRAHKTSPQTTVHPRLGKVQIPIKHQLSDCRIKLGLFSDWTRNHNQTLSSPQINHPPVDRVWNFYLLYYLFLCSNCSGLLFTCWRHLWIHLSNWLIKFLI